MKSFWKTTVTAVALAVVWGAAPAQGGVHVDIGVGVPGVVVGIDHPRYYYGPGFYPPGPCDEYDYYYSGDCGYAMYTGRIFIDGVWVYGPHYYRWWNGEPLFWYRGRWHSWDGWTGIDFSWNHFEGWGWHGGHWDRGWGNEHGGWHGTVRGDEHWRDHHDHDRGDHGDHRYERRDHAGNEGGDRLQDRHDHADRDHVAHDREDHSGHADRGDHADHSDRGHGGEDHSGGGHDHHH